MMSSKSCTTFVILTALGLGACAENTRRDDTVRARADRVEARDRMDRDDDVTLNRVDRDDRDNDLTRARRDNNGIAADRRANDDDSRLVSRTITFARGSAILSAASKTALSDLAARARGAGNRHDIEDIKVSVWADQSFQGPKTDLPPAARDLADKRADAVEDYLEDVLDLPTVEAFSMAERSNWLARLFNTDEAEIKSQTAMRNGDMSNAKFTKLRAGGPSKAVVVIEYDLED